MGFFERLSFSWCNGLVFKAQRGQLKDSDLPLPEDQLAERNFNKFQEEWAKEMESAAAKGKKPSLITALRHSYGTEFAFAGFFKLLWSGFVIMGAFFFVRSLLAHVDPKRVSVYDPKWAGNVLLVLFFVDAWLLGLSLQRMGDLCLRVGIKMRAALVSVVAKKAFAMASVKQELSADIVGFVASDIHKVYDGIQQLHYLWTAPIEALSILALLSSLTKQYAAPGFAIVALIVPLQYYFGYLTAKLKYANAPNAGGRVALAQEVLPCMKLVKYYCWEPFFKKEFAAIRAREWPTHKKLLFVRAINIAIVFTTPPLTAFTIFTAFEFGVGRLNSSLAFTTLSLFNIMRFPLVVLPKAIRTASEAGTAIKRLEEFLMLDIDIHENTSSNNRPGVNIQNASFRYPESHDDFKLQIPNFVVRPGEVVGICGKVGSGKTSVVNAILGHCVPEQGHCEVGGRMGYVRQTAWLQNIALRENILFGEEFNEKKYNQVVSSCALELDFQILAQGDETKAGLRGINLSGGQRQRVNLARAVYSPAEVCLLDSPLSAVDYHTAHHIFQHCIRGLLNKRAVVLVSHSLEVLPQCDKIAVMDEGKMVYFGKFDISVINRYMPSPANDVLESASAAVTSTPAAQGGAVRPPPKGGRAMTSPTLTKAAMASEDAKAKQGFRVPMFRSMRIFWLEGGLFLGILTLFVYCTAQTTRQMSDWWIRQWVNDTLDLYGGKDKESKSASTKYALTYMGLMSFFGIMNFCRGLLFFTWTIKAANGFFKKYVDRTFSAPLAFFLNNPVGDLINVFSKDQDVADEQLPEALHFTGIYGLILLSTVVTVSTVINKFSIFGAMLIIVSLGILWVYLPCATQLKFRVADASGALTTLVSEALEGLDVIQAYHKQEYIIGESEKRLNAYHRYLFNAESLNLWLAFYCDFIGAVLVLAVALFAVVQKKELGAANVGLAFSNVIQMLVFYTWVIRFLGDTISYWGSIERVSGLATQTPRETDGDNLLSEEGGKLVVKVDNPNWKPTRGGLKFTNVWMRYKSNLPWALKGVSFEILPREKVGVVGRTGSGKSTLLLALYRMFELGGGTIHYDGIDINALSRDRLRKALSIIPQEPLMFTGTVRVNLDPFGERTDEELWTALEKVGLKGHVRGMDGGLSGKVDGTTSEWSLGQKQLVCLARAALSRVPVLCLDEATQAMDPTTEILVLQTIDELFADRTILTIAHRLDVVIQSDKILVMDQGEMIELDRPDVLLDNTASLFSQLVDRMGPTQAAGMRFAAREHAQAKGLR